MDVDATMRRLGLLEMGRSDDDANNDPRHPIRAPFFERLKRVSSTSPVILDGPNGTGKTHAVHQLAAEEGAILYPQQAYRTLAVEDIRGTRGLNEHGTTFDPGPLVLSLQDPCGWYLLEEANMADPGITSLLHNLLDGTREITVPELGKSVSAGDNWRCFMTRNSGFAGTVEMNRALESRCVIIESDHFPKATEIRLLLERCPDMADHAETVIAMANVVRSSRSNGDHEFEMDIRTIIQLAEEWETTGEGFDAFSNVVLPKIGDRYTYAPVRDALLEAVLVILT